MLGDRLFGAVGGGNSLTRACAARLCTYAHVIGTGNGRIMGRVAALMAAGELRAVVDSEHTLDDALAAIARQKSGRAAGKVVVNVVPAAA